MRSKSFIAVCGVLVVLLAASGGVYAYDSSREDLIAKGIRIGSVDVGGVRADVARERLRTSLLGKLRRPVTVTHADRTFTLTPERARVGVNIDRSVDEAVQLSRSGNLIARIARSVRGGRLNAEVPVSITYDRAAVRGVVDRVEKAVERKPVDAEVDFDGGRVAPRASRDGVRVEANRLERDVAAALTGLDAVKTVAVRTRVAKPRVTTEELADSYPAVLIVDRSRFRLQLYRNLKPAKTYRIAVGAAGLETPKGLYRIQNKAENPAWHVPDSEWAGKLRGKIIPPDDPRNPIEARWMGIYDGAGIHGTTATSSLGTAASHGCIRMAIPDVIELYDKVPVQAPVYIL